MFDFLVNQFYTNNFMTAAVVAAPVTALTYAARNIPVKLWHAAKRTLTTDIRFNSDMHGYDTVQDYVLRNVISQRWSRTYKYHSERSWNHESERTEILSSLGVGYGNHFGWWRGRPVWVERSTQESQGTEKFKETLELTFLGRDTSPLKTFVEEMEKFVQNGDEEDKVWLYVNNDGSWQRMAGLPPRPLTTVLTNEGQGQTAVNHVLRFVESKAWYRQRGLPHHTGILLEGVPGTGKSSLIHALASETKRNLFYLNLGSITEEKELTSLIGERKHWSNALLVIEDVDSSGAAVQRDDKNTVITLSTLLNILDGILSPDGLVVLATTNHPEALDPALIRPGRFDLVMRLGPLEWPQFVAMAALFEVDPARVAALRPLYKPTPGATLRSLIIGQSSTALEDYFSAA